MSKQQKDANPLDLLCSPYVFALKEGGAIQHDLMDYSLILMQRNCAEVIHAPSAEYYPSNVMMVTRSDENRVKAANLS